MEEKKEKKDPTVLVRTGEGLKEFPKDPSLWQSLKEGFEPTNTRANLDAVRARRQKYGT